MEVKEWEWEVGERVELLSEDGWEAGVIHERCPEWHWHVCQYTVEFERLGLRWLDINAAAGLRKAASQ